MPRKPLPIQCTPCRVKYEGTRYRVYPDGSVSLSVQTAAQAMELGLKTVGELREYDYSQERHSPQSDLARQVRQEAARQRRNRNARERHAALKSLGLTKTPYGRE